MNMNHKSNSRQNRMAEIISCEQKLKKKKSAKNWPNPISTNQIGSTFNNMKLTLAWELWKLSWLAQLAISLSSNK